MLLEYFQMVDRVESVDLAAGHLKAISTTPEKSPVFEGHFPGMPLVPGVLLIETMAQACGFLVLAATDFAAMPFLVSVDEAKLRVFVEPATRLEINATLEHAGSGYAVAKARISSGGRTICNAQLKLKTLPFPQAPILEIVRSRSEEVGLLAAIERNTTAGRNP